MRDTDLVKRVGISSVLILLIACIIFFSKEIWAQAIMLLTILCLSVVASYEFQYLMKRKEYSYPSILLFVLTPLLVLSFYSMRFFGESFFGIPFFTLFFSLILIGFFYFRRIENSFAQLSSCFFSLCYIGIPLGLLLLLIYPTSGKLDYGRMTLTYLLVVTKITDIGAYFVGKYMGKRKMAKIVSPKKTVEGLVGGIIFAMIGSLCFVKASFFESMPFPILQATFLGLAVGIVGQMGDLVESLLKRDAKVKDSNRIPGLGGILDMLDSLLFTIPLVFLYMQSISQ